MNDLKQIQDFFSKPLKEENQPQFKKGDKVTYLGHPAVVTATKEYNGKNFVSVSYDKGTGKTKASDILATSGAVKPLKENVDKKYNDFLISLRDSGVTNMYGAAPYLEKAFGLNRKEAIEILANWMRSFKSASINEELNLSNYGKVTPPKGGASLVGKYNSIQGKSKYDTVIFDYQEGSDKPYGIVQVEGHGIYGSDLLKRLGLRQTRSWTAGVDVYIHDGNYTPVYVSEDDFKALLDFWSGGLDREAKAQADFYRSRGNTSGTIDEAKVDYDFSERELIRVLRQLKRGASTEVDIIKAFTKALGRDLTKDELFSESIAKINEATEEDKIDIVTMDVPLFIRILEYSREDAQTDMDLHDLAEKAITSTKQQGILSMDDYNMLVGDSESLNEQSLDDQAKAYFLAKVKRGEIDTLPEDPKAAFLAQMMKDQMDHDKETLRRERGLEERISKALNELNEELCAKGKRYIKARKRAGEKSSAYLSGRAVKVCKGQIDWPKKGRKKVNEIEDNGGEEKAFDAELMATANGIASALGKELKAKQGNKEKLDEAIITTAIAGVLTANALVGFISKMAAKLFKKLNFKKGEDIAKKIHKFAHDNETAFQAPIKRVLKFFIKDEQKLDTITKAVYAIVVASMAAGYGADAVSGLAKADWFKGALSSLKALAKSDEAIVNAYPAIKSLVA